MKRRCWFIYGIMLSILFACSNLKKKQKICVHKTINHTTIDSLLDLEKYELARIETFSILKKITPEQSSELSCLYSRIGTSYNYSFHFDSAVYYSKLAYDYSLNLGKDLQAKRAAELLNLYDQSAAYHEEQEKMFSILSNLKKDSLETKTQAIILDAQTEYYDRRQQYEMCLYLPTEILKLYKNYQREHILNHQDSLRIGLTYIRLANAYITKYYSYALEIDSLTKDVDVSNELLNMKIARGWIGNNSRLLALYYSTSIYASFSQRKMDMELYRDSIIRLAKLTGANFNSLIVRANINIADYYYYFDDHRLKKTKICWKYYHDAMKYNNNLIEPDAGCNLLYLSGDLLMRENKYDSALVVLRSMSGQCQKLLMLRQQLGYTLSIAKCYENLDLLDSAIIYYKENIRLADSLQTLNGGKTFAEAESKYRIRLNQEKIAAQNIIIKYTQRQKLGLLIGILIAIGFILLLAVLYKKMNRQNETLHYLNKRLEEANNTKAKLFAIISHDFRSPVNQVYQLLKLQQSKNILIDPGEKNSLEKQTQAATVNLLYSMEDLLIWSKTQMQSFKVVVEKVDICRMFEQCTDLLQPLMQTKQLQLVIEAPKGSFVYTDPNFLLTIIRNLLQNAINASPEKEQIIINYAGNENENPVIKIKNVGTAFTQRDYLRMIAETSNLLRGGLGLLIVDELSKEIGAGVFFEVEGKHTCCNIVF